MTFVVGQSVRGARSIVNPNNSFTYVFRPVGTPNWLDLPSTPFAGWDFFLKRTGHGIVTAVGALAKSFTVNTWSDTLGSQSFTLNDIGVTVRVWNMDLGEFETLEYPESALVAAPPSQMAAVRTFDVDRAGDDIAEIRAAHAAIGA